LERYGLDLLVDLSRCPEVENGSDVVRLEITERDPGGGVEDLRACAAHHWHIERGDAVVQIARAVLRRLGEIATGAAEQRSSARDRFGRVPSTENVLVQQSLVAEPVVARVAAELRKAVVDSAGRRPVALLAPWPDGRRWAAAITHDLDVVDRWPVFTALRLAELARKGELRRVARTLGSALTAIGRSPIQSALRVLLGDERARGIVSTWFVLCGTPTLKTMRAGDLTYLPEGSGAAAALRELREQFHQVQVASAVTAVSGAGVEIRIEGPFDDRAMSDLVNEVRNAGAEAVGVNGRRVGPRSWFARTDGGVTIDGQLVSSPYRVQAIGAPETIRVALTRTGGIVGQLELIYGKTRFLVSTVSVVDLPAAPAADFRVARPAR